MFFTGSYWIGRFFPFNTRAWAIDFLCLFMLPFALLLVVAHGFTLIIRHRKWNGFIIYLVVLVLLVHYWQPGYKMFTYGFRDHFRDGKVIDLIHNWVKGIDPELCDFEWSADSGNGTCETPIETSLRFPEEILVLKPTWLTLDTDSRGHPKVKLEWYIGSDFIYGIEIGSETMTIPQTRERVNDAPGEFRLPVNTNAYVLCKIN